MIASFSKNFIFIRTRKTASTSTEIALGTACGPDDIQTPVGVDDELVRLRYGGGPKNFCIDAGLEGKYRNALKEGKPKGIALLYREIMTKLNFHHHMSAAEIRKKVDCKFWNGAIKFAVERHPYEKVISLVYWRNRKKEISPHNLHYFIDEAIEKGEYRNFDLYSEQGKPIVDFVLRYEELDLELERISNVIGIKLPDRLPNSKSQYRKNRESAFKILNSVQKAKIRELCDEEFDLLCYPA